MSHVILGPPDAMCFRWIAGYSNAIIEAHALGHCPGASDEPWSSGFQRSVVHIYRESLPTEYLGVIAVAFANCARTRMDDLVGCPRGSWEIVVGFSAAMSDALGSDSDLDTSATQVVQWPLVGDGPPAAIDFVRLSRLVSTSGVTALYIAASNVCAASLTGTRSPLSDEELVWLRRLAAGDRTIDVATDSGLSERSLYRRLRAVWVRLGVGTKTEGIAVALREGWLY